MQHKSVLFLMCFLPMAVSAAELLADEQGPTAPEAVTTETANEDFLLPTYVAPGEPESVAQTAVVPSEIDILNEIFGSPDPVPAATEQIVKRPIQQTFSPRTGVEKTKESEILTPLAPLPIIPTDILIEPKKQAFKQSRYVDQALAMATTPPSGLAMPREIRITFYPGQSTFSAQALKWAKSFALRVVNDPKLLVEIRVSEQSWKVQEKRLRILSQVLKETGISAHQIRVYKTARDENSILMGYAYNPEYTLMGNGKNSNEREQKTIDW